MDTSQKAGAGGLIWAQISLAHSMPKYSPETVEAILETIRTTGSARADQGVSGCSRVAPILGKSQFLTVRDFSVGNAVGSEVKDFIIA
jgi:hypothetical protein